MVLLNLGECRSIFLAENWNGYPICALLYQQNNNQLLSVIVVNSNDMQIYIILNAPIIDLDHFCLHIHLFSCRCVADNKFITDRNKKRLCNIIKKKLELHFKTIGMSMHGEMIRKKPTTLYFICSPLPLFMGTGNVIQREKKSMILQFTGDENISLEYYAA